MELELAHLEGSGVLVPQEVADEAAVLADLLRPFAVGDARSLDHGLIAAHVVHDPDEAVVQHLEGDAQDLV